jgi:hypothetical protein
LNSKLIEHDWQNATTKLKEPYKEKITRTEYNEYSQRD